MNLVREASLPYIENLRRLPTTAVIRNKLAFVIHTPDLVNHYAPVWDALDGTPFDVISYSPTLNVSELEVARWSCNIVESNHLLEQGHLYRYLVSNHAIQIGVLPKMGVANIRFMYAAGKGNWNFSDWNDLYDVILCFGPYHAARFQQCSRAIVAEMGYPRFDRFFTEKPKREILYREFGCDTGKPCVVWLPTWLELSSVGHFSEEIEALSEQFNVLVKLHPLMTEQEQERVQQLKKLRFTRLITDARDNMPLYQIADYMLFDYGGPPMAGIYTDKKMLLLDVPGAESNELTGADSPDIEIRNNLLHIKSGQRPIAEIFSDGSVWADQELARRSLRETYFAPNFGNSAQVAASILKNLDEILLQE